MISSQPGIGDYSDLLQKACIKNCQCGQTWVFKAQGGWIERHYPVALREVLLDQSIQQL